MDLAYSQEDRAFRKKLRAWLKTNLPKKDKAVRALPPHHPRRIQRAKAWQRTLYDAGLRGAGPGRRHTAGEVTMTSCTRPFSTKNWCWPGRRA